MNDSILVYGPPLLLGIAVGFFLALALPAPALVVVLAALGLISLAGLLALTNGQGGDA